MTKKELFKRHEIKCKNCTLKDCDGIHLTINNTTKCEEGELNESNNNTIHK